MSADQPTVQEVEAQRTQAGEAPLLAFGWQANHDYASDYSVDHPAATDIVQFLKPDGDANVWITECFETVLTYTDEPDWSSAPSAGDSLADGDVSWVNFGPYSAWPPTPQTWTPDTSLPDYQGGYMVWPTVPNGHLYIWYPFYNTGGTGSSEPTWPTDGYYVLDGDGYWWDAGTGYAPAAASTFTASAWLFGGRQRHHRLRDHFGFEDATNVTLSSPLGPFLEGTPIPDVIEALLSRLDSLESTTKRLASVTADAAILAPGGTIETSSGTWRAVFFMNAVAKKNYFWTFTMEAAIAKQPASFTVDARLIQAFTANAVIA